MSFAIPKLLGVLALSVLVLLGSLFLFFAIRKMAPPESSFLNCPKDRLRMNEQNPYKPMLSEPAKPLKRIRWVRRFSILNCVIFSIPLLGAFAAYLVSEANGIHISGVSVAVGTELAVVLIAYLAIPNFIMIALWLRTRRSP